MRPPERVIRGADTNSRVTRRPRRCCTAALRLPYGIRGNGGGLSAADYTRTVPLSCARVTRKCARPRPRTLCAAERSRTWSTAGDIVLCRAEPGGRVGGRGRKWGRGKSVCAREQAKPSDLPPVFQPSLSSPHHQQLTAFYPHRSASTKLQHFL